MSTVKLGEQLKNAFIRNGLDPINDLLFARITIYDESGESFPPKKSIVSLHDTGDGSLNMSEEEFYDALNKFSIEDGYGSDPVTGTVWFTNNYLFIRQEYDGWGHWMFINPVPPEDIDPKGLWLE